MSHALPLLLKKKQIPLVAFYKRATVSESLFKKEQKTSYSL